ncbi:hypothetical protein EIP91_001325 [Steccherinum ochraceum]|uniref:Uncharacterized protein n=1 Tax=Steccherinum ochraceum TaxID=92696 RepID=A0A4R0RE97_9APHY|nr:hypothetical protein EIP91_001325 [Steccherinum ochraceum]
MSALHSPSQGKSSWWSRSKSAKDLPSLRTGALLPDKSSVHSSGTGSAKSSTSSKFNTFVHSAIGKKSRKPTLTIQDPPPSISIRHSPSFTSAKSTAEPTPLNSPSSPQPSSSEYGHTLRYYDLDQSSDFHTVSEPRTPSDVAKDRSSYQHSVLTLSDPDPFASGSMIFSPFAQEINRSSVYSDNSLLDPNSKRPDMMLYNNRISYGSSSSNSHSNPSADGHGARSTMYSSRSQGSRRPSEASSKIPERHRRQTSTGVESSQAAMAFARGRNDTQATGGSGSSHSTITERNRRGNPSAGSGVPLPSRSNAPQVRPRGMTVAGAVRPNTASGGLGFGSVSGMSAMSAGPLRRKASETFSSGRMPSDNGSPVSSSPITFTRTRTSSTDTNSTTFPTSAAPSINSSRPVVLVRKASSSRLLVPPLNAAPPEVDLPPTPPTHSRLSSFLSSIDDFQAQLNFPEPPSSSASSLSFASQIDLTDIGGDGMHFVVRDSFIDKAMSSYPDLSPSATVRGFNVPSSPSSSRQPTASSSVSPQKTLKKAISQSSLLGKRYSANSVASSIFSNEEPIPTPVKQPKKQRSFHHTRIPLPPLPSLRHTSSHHSTSTSPPLPNESPTSSQFFSSDQKKPTSPPHTRKRLFSGSSLRRNSQSTQQSPTSPTTSTTSTSPDDDNTRSGSSMDSTASGSDRRGAKPIMMSFATFGNHVSLVTENACIAPSWEEPLPPLQPIRRESQSEYVPQYIMSPEAMLKLEEELAAESEHKGSSIGGGRNSKGLGLGPSSPTPKTQLEPEDLGLHPPIRKPVLTTRPRTSSAVSGTSMSSLAYAREDPVALASNGTLQSLSPPRPRVVSSRSDRSVSSEVDPGRFGFRSTSVLAGAVTKPLALKIRPSTTQSAISPPTTPKTIRHHSPERPSTALPPPPRPRPSREPQQQHLREPSKSSVVDPSYKRASVMPINPLSPPPRRKNSVQSNAPSTITIKEPPKPQPRDRPGTVGQASRPPSSFDPARIMQRRSIMKKPSFLEIEDDADSESDDLHNLVDMSLDPLTASPTMESSFLDLDRGSSFDSFRDDD